MDNVINYEFRRKPMKSKMYNEFHSMRPAREDNWLLWRCHQCSRKVKISLTTSEFTIERKGNFFSHYTYQFYHPSKEEFEKSDLPPNGL